MSYRVSTDEIVAALKETGVRPIQGAFQAKGNGGCGMTIMARYLDLEADTFIDDLNAIYGKAYVNGFISGWDNTEDLAFDDAIEVYGLEGAFRRADGSADGRAAYEAVTGIRTESKVDDWVKTEVTTTAELAVAH